MVCAAVENTLRKNLVPIQTAPVVLDGDTDTAAFVKGVEADDALFRLSRGHAFIRRFQPMIC